LSGLVVVYHVFSQVYVGDVADGGWFCYRNEWPSRHCWHSQYSPAETVRIFKALWVESFHFAIYLEFALNSLTLLSLGHPKCWINKIGLTLIW